MPEDPPRQFDTLREAFAAVYRCTETDFDHRVFWKGLYRHAWLPAHWMWWAEREFFQTDIEAIHALGFVRCEADLERAIDDLENQGLVERSIRRGRLMIRLSPSRLIAVLRPLLPLLRPLAGEAPETFAVRASAHAPGAAAPRTSRALPPDRAQGGAHALRTLKRLHAEIVAGRNLDAALAAADLTRAEAQAALARVSADRPELEWLRGYLADLAELEQLRGGRREPRH